MSHTRPEFRGRFPSRSSSGGRCPSKLYHERIGGVARLDQAICQMLRALDKKTAWNEVDPHCNWLEGNPESP
jgi:hypothetical protein